MRFIQHPITHELVPAEEYERPNERHHLVQSDIEPFISPIDKTIISSRAHLREHNRKHNVTNAADYSTEYIEKKKAERRSVFNSNKERKQVIYDAWVAAERG